ncbi:GNAT family protein [Pedobacter sp.]|jgi:ribosomal-protein-serine acetyltransferase|uniref:GNAT family N-acetyltransferase n=1 Tax=Pedobacter sp. TaxID=1411316 RepID=UPI002CC71D0E|nr:GNAT family protein [Pedobacter sp.]HWW40161.1 GNAT family protein [Pedobacter sp.]
MKQNSVFSLNVDDHIKLELTHESQADVLFNAIDNNRKHLSAFLPWVGNMQSVNDLKAYIKGSEVLIQQQKEISFAILYEQVVVGRIGLHHLNILNRSGAIGYWLIKEAEGKGIVTKSCKSIINYGFNELGLNRIEIKAAVCNLRSQAVPEKLNFRREGLLRQAELVNNEFLDLVLYSLLRHELDV